MFDARKVDQETLDCDFHCQPCSDATSSVGDLTSSDSGFRDPSGSSAQQYLRSLSDYLESALVAAVSSYDHKAASKYLTFERLRQQWCNRRCNRNLEAWELCKGVADLLIRHRAPTRDELAQQLCFTMDNSINKNDLHSMITCLEELLQLVDAMKLDVANRQIRTFRMPLIEDGVSYQEEYLLQSIRVLSGGPEGEGLSNQLDLILSSKRRCDGAYAICAPRDRQKNEGGSALHWPHIEEGQDALEADTSMLLQPDNRSLTPIELVNEVRTIYSGLDMMDENAVDIIRQRASQRDSCVEKLSNDQLQALDMLHRTLLDENLDLYQGSQLGIASLALRCLAPKFVMPALDGRTVANAFLDLSREQQPGSCNNMLSFVYSAYSLVALLMWCVPEFLDSWIQSFGDFNRGDSDRGDDTRRERRFRLSKDDATGSSKRQDDCRWGSLLPRPLRRLLARSFSTVSRGNFPLLSNQLQRFFLVTIASSLPRAHARPTPIHGTLSEAIEDEFTQFLRATIGTTFSWTIPFCLFISFAYILKKMPPEEHLSQYRMMAGIASLGPSIASDIRGSVHWWTLLNTVSFSSITRYAQASRPGFHKSPWWLVFIIGGTLLSDFCMGWTFSPSQGNDSKLFGQLLAPSMWMMVVVMDLVTTYRTSFRSALAGLSEMLN